jgi:deoxyribose-phosphate aldolase
MPDRSPARRCLAALDLTDLSDHANEASLDALCDLAQTAHGPVAAVCVWPRFVARARSRLDGTGIKVATVANFPAGGQDAEAVRREVEAAVDAGADEIDVVIPWRAILDDRMESAIAVLSAGREAAGAATLKWILETGELRTPEAIALASAMAIEEGGADFLKTSTGTTDVSATPQAVEIMLDVISGSGHDCGLKVSGGVREARDAVAYLAMADEAMADFKDDDEPYWATPARFRIGASRLRDALILQIESEPKS